MRSSRLYLATRSERDGAPVLIWPVPIATTRSAIVVSSVSPERWLTTAVQPALAREVDRVDRLGQRADLVELDQDRVRGRSRRCRGRCASGSSRAGRRRRAGSRRRAARSAPASRPSRPRPGRPRARRSGSARPSRAHRSMSSPESSVRPSRWPARSGRRAVDARCPARRARSWPGRARSRRPRRAGSRPARWPAG